MAGAETRCSSKLIGILLLDVHQGHVTEEVTARI
jgi:hypothetical protein